MSRLGPPLIVLVTLSTSGCILDRSGTGGVDDDGGARDGGADAVVGPSCGDGTIDPGEDCDRDALGGASCATLGFTTGNLRCGASCAYDTSLCDTPCGNGAVDPGEDCDGSDLDGMGCAAVGLTDGSLGCNLDCTFDSSACLGCGNGHVDGAEECDGSDLGGQSCTGALACDASCRLSIAGCGVPSAGDGRDGDLVVDADTDFGERTGAPSWPVGAIDGVRASLKEDATGLAAGDEVLVLAVQGEPGACADAGHYELARVAAVAGGEVDLTAPLAGSFGFGSGSPVVLMQRVPSYFRVAINGTATLRPAPWDGSRGGVIAFRARELSIAAGAALSAEGRGFRGGLGWRGNGRRDGRRGESLCGNPQDESTAANDGGGGGGRHVDPGDGCGQGGGGGGYGGVGTSYGYASECVRVGARDPAGNGGRVYGGRDLGAAIYLGSGGGAGATDDDSNDSGNGGPGGGLVLVWAATAAIDGLISVRGGPGEVAPDTNDAGNGGGGSGGTLVLRAATLTGAGRFDASGGPGEPGRTDWNSAGGDGGIGRIRLDFFSVDGLAYGTPEAMDRTAAMCTPLPDQRERFFE